MNRILLCYLFLLPATAQTMELVSPSNNAEMHELCLNKEDIYHLFTQNKKIEAKQLLPQTHHQQKQIVSLFKYGIKQNNKEFIQWLLITKKPHFEFIIEPIAYSKKLNHTQITILLEHYDREQRDTLKKQCEEYAQKEAAKIEREKKGLAITAEWNKNLSKNNPAPQIAWAPITKSNKAQWDTWIKDAEPMPEPSYTIKNGEMIRVEQKQEDCNCIII